MSKKSEVRNLDDASTEKRLVPAEKKAPRAIDRGVLEDHVGFFARELQLWIFQVFTETFRDVDIRPVDYSVLVVIGANPGLSQNAVADTLGIDRARLVGILDGLQQRGLIERRASVVDRRARMLFLTGEGERFLNDLKARAAEIEVKFASYVGRARRKALLQILKEVEDKLKSGPGPIV